MSVMFCLAALQNYQKMGLFLYNFKCFKREMRWRCCVKTASYLGSNGVARTLKKLCTSKGVSSNNYVPS